MHSPPNSFTTYMYMYKLFPQNWMDGNKNNWKKPRLLIEISK